MLSLNIDRLKSEQLPKAFREGQSGRSKPQSLSMVYSNPATQIIRGFGQGGKWTRLWETGANARRQSPPAELKLSDPPRAGVTFYQSACLTCLAYGFNTIGQPLLCLLDHFQAPWQPTIGQGNSILEMSKRKVLLAGHMRLLVRGAEQSVLHIFILYR